jgi:hypothetical protein
MLQNANAPQNQPMHNMLQETYSTNVKHEKLILQPLHEKNRDYGELSVNLSQNRC